MLHKLRACLGIALENTPDGTGDHAGVGFLHATHHAAHVYPFDHYGHALGFNHFIDEISNRLDIKIKPIQLTKRQVLIDRLIYDAKVVEAIQAYSEKRGIPREVTQARVLRYAREIVPSFNAYIYFRIGYWLAKKIARLMYKVRVDRVDNEKLAKIEKDSTVVFVMNHRSNMDYILVAFLAMERTTLSYAVGEWARIWPLHSLIRAMGAFFVRRKSDLLLQNWIKTIYFHTISTINCRYGFAGNHLYRGRNAGYDVSWSHSLRQFLFYNFIEIGLPEYPPGDGQLIYHAFYIHIVLSQKSHNGVQFH